MKLIQQIKTKSLVLALVGSGLVGLSMDWNDFEVTKNLELFSKIFQLLNTHYVDEVDPEQLMETGVKAMLNSLDPYTTYIPADDVTQFESVLQGHYVGLGVSAFQDSTHSIINAVYENGPAQKAGLQIGDKLLRIDGESVVRATKERVSERMRGLPGTTVELVVLRNNEEKKMVVTRDEISVSNVPYYGLLEGDIAYIVLEIFSKDAGKNVANALVELQAKTKLKGVILDLRNNGGGLLTEAINVANVFLDKGQTILQVKGRKKNHQKIYRTLNTPVNTQVPLAVLINEASASSSEIVAGALQDLDRAIIVGQRSFGKGLVQGTRELRFGAKLKMTVARFYIPSGRCIQALKYKNGKIEHIPDSLRTVYTTKRGRKVYGGGGIQPDVELDNTELLTLINSLKKEFYWEYIFDYKRKHPTIAPAKQFQLTEQDFEQFLTFLDSKGYEYKTRTGILLEELKKNAEEEHYSKILDKELKSIKQVLSNANQTELHRQKERLVHLLQKQIATTYYYERGGFEAGIQSDLELQKAKALLTNSQKYSEILKSK